MFVDIINDAIELLEKLISVKSFSKEEDGTRELLCDFLQKRGVLYSVLGNNIYAKNKYFDEHKKSVLLNSHHDTVKPNKAYTKDPYLPEVIDGKLYGLGSNDAGGCLVSLLATFIHFYDKEDLPFNLVFAASCEEEVSGKNGMSLLFPVLGEIEFAIVGEPTLMDMAIAEKGLMVIDGSAHGISGHAARDEGRNSIDIALKDIQWLHSYVFPKESKTLGAVKATVTQINAGKQHNVIPALCDFTIDVRSIDGYTNEEIFDILQQNMSSELKARSFRLRPSSISEQHGIVKAGKQLGMNTYGSPTLSDQALMSCSSLKLGPGDSARSHTADEFIYVSEIEEAIPAYITLLNLYAKEV